MENRDPLVFFLLSVGPFHFKLTTKNVGWKKRNTEQCGSIGNPYTLELPNSLFDPGTSIILDFTPIHTDSERDLFSYVMSVRPYVRPSVCKHLPARLRIEGLL